MEKESKEQSPENETQPEDVYIDNMDEDCTAKQKLNSSTDPGNIKFTTVNLDNKNGEAKVDIHVVQTTVGMGKEELMKYANEPYWVRLRLFLFVLFWVGWIAMLVGAVVIILLAPRCPPPPKLEWYQKTSMYQVDVKSFKDGDGNGIGDLKGLTSKLDYFKALNVKTLLLNVFYAMSPGDSGVVNHTSIDSRFGTMADFDTLVREMKERRMQIVVDFIPNQSSDEHPWFQASKDRQAPYTDYYVWVDGKGNGPPNNWVSVDGGSSWEWYAPRKQYYLHTYGKDQPDLNLHNDDVRQEMKEILKFWLGKNVDGFKVKSASHLLPNQAWRDEPVNTPFTANNPTYGEVNHIYTLDQEENFDIFAEWRDVLNNYTSTFETSPKILMAELSGHLNDTARYYGNGSHTLVDFPLNTELTKLNEGSLAYDLKGHLDVWKNSTPTYAWPNWVLGNEYTTRLTERVGYDLVDGLYMVAALLRGTPITYYGDEIGMTSTPDESLAHGIVPMIWQNGSSAGFTNYTSFVLPLSSRSSVTVEDALKDKTSHLKIFKRLNELREQPAVNFGVERFPVLTEDIFSLMRIRKGSPGYLVVFNMGANATVVDFSGKSGHLPETGRLEVRSRNINSGPLAEGDNPKVKFNNIPLNGKQAAVFSFVPKFED